VLYARLFFVLFCFVVAVVVAVFAVVFARAGWRVLDFVE
jgi:lipopolysaccharide export LptBFGC system permease protein LptF